MFKEPNQHFFPQGLDLPFFVFEMFPWELLDKLNTHFQHLEGSVLVEIPKGVYVENLDQITIEAGARIESGCFIRGPCFIGSGATIRHGAYLRGNVWIGQNSIIGHGCEVKNCIVGRNTSLAHFVYVADSVIGNFVNLASHVTLANLRLDEKSVLPMHKKKFGAVIGDHTKLGCHVVLNPGKQLPPHTNIYLKQDLIIQHK